MSAPWLRTIVLDDTDDGNYVIPNIESVVVGGTHQTGDWDTVSGDTIPYHTIPSHTIPYQHRERGGGGHTPDRRLGHGERGHHTIPYHTNIESVVVGGTHQTGDWDTVISY